MLGRLNNIIREAGTLAMRHYAGNTGVWEKGPGQIVTDADIEVDRFLKHELRALCDAAWLSEESEDDQARLNNERVWIVDPIDGTRSFAAGIPEFTICAALWEQGEIVLAAVFNPASEELFEAEKSKGAYLNGARMSVREPPDKKKARLVVSKSEHNKLRFDKVFPEASITTIGSLAYKVVLVASGKFDAYVSMRRCHDWDIAASALVLKEAGGLLSDPYGGDICFNQEVPRHRGLVAAHPCLQPAISARLARPPA